MAAIKGEIRRFTDLGHKGVATRTGRPPLIGHLTYEHTTCTFGNVHGPRGGKPLEYPCGTRRNPCLDANSPPAPSAQLGHGRRAVAKAGYQSIVAMPRQSLSDAIHP